MVIRDSRSVTRFQGSVRYLGGIASGVFFARFLFSEPTFVISAISVSHSILLRHRLNLAFLRTALISSNDA